ncbi:MAG TPA: hypothetical protein VKY22_04315 [Bradyrhizobium sp.]|nr:hypothetical protein [Bradyrhizobium sp.]
MTISVSHAEEPARRLGGRLAARFGGLLPLWVGLAVYTLLVVAGNTLLNDPDTLWQVTLGQWILDHQAVPHEDIYSFTMRGEPWISTQWLAQILYAKAYDWAGWTGPVVLAAAAIAATYALLARYLVARLSESASLVFVCAALALSMPHLLARPHVLAMPFMVLWIGGMVAAADRREAPSFWLLPNMVLWANLHGGFVFGLMMVGPIALDAVAGADRDARKMLALRWALFGLAALLASCCNPYGFDALLASRKILGLGRALQLITEWHAADFGRVGAFEIYLLLGIGLMLYRGVTLPATRILILLGLLHMALSQGRAAEILALVAPMLLALPLARQIGAAIPAEDRAAPHGALIGVVAAMLVAGTAVYASVHRFEPNLRGAPVAAVTELKTLDVTRVLNDYDFGGYLIYRGVDTFIDGRTELFGEKFFVDHNNASGLAEPENLFRLLAQYRIDATFLRTQSAAARLLDHMDGWEKVYSDDLATIHVRKAGAVHTREPVIDETIR